MSESRLREEMASFGEMLTGLGLAHGSTGNISVRLDDGWLITPTNSRLGRLDPARIAKLDPDGRHLGGDKPSKEAFLHRCVYDMRPGAGAIVHLHSTHSVAVSCLAGIDADDVLPPLTAYYVMRVGRLPLIPYFPPGDERLAGAVRQVAARHAAVLLANHGPVVAGKSLDAAVGAMEELEATAKLYLLLQDRPTRAARHRAGRRVEAPVSGRLRVSRTQSNPQVLWARGQPTIKMWFRARERALVTVDKIHRFALQCSSVHHSDAVLGRKEAAVRARRGKKLATRVTVSVDERDYEQLSALAEEYRVSLAWLVRYAVSDLLERQRNDQLQLPLELTASGRRR